jgi:hypothetical protein
MNPLLVLLLLAPSLACAADEPPPPLKVFVLAGTSNMLGRPAKVDDLPDDLRKPIADVLVNAAGGWTPLEAGKNLVGNEATFGLAVSKHLGEPIGIIWISAASSADKSPAAGLNNLVKQSREKGRPIVIAGMLVDVSYRDGNDERAKAYRENMTQWIETTRRELGNPELPIVLMRAIPPKSKTSHLETVRRAQDTLKLPRFRLVPSDDIERGGDQVHFTTRGRLELGKRYAAAMIELLK